MIITSCLAQSTLISIPDFHGNKRFDRATRKKDDDPKLTLYEISQKIYQEYIIDQIYNDEILSNWMCSLWIQQVILLGSASFQQKSLSLLLCVRTCFVIRVSWYFKSMFHGVFGPSFLCRVSPLRGRIWCSASARVFGVPPLRGCVWCPASARPCFPLIQIPRETLLHKSRSVVNLKL